MGKLLFEENTSKIMGKCFCVQNGLTAGFLEPVTQEALEKYFKIQKVNPEIKMKLHLYDDQAPLRNYFIAEVACFDKIITALFFKKGTEAQTIHQPLGLLINSGYSSETWRGSINTK